MLTKSQHKKIEIFGKKTALKAGKIALKYWGKNLKAEIKSTSADLLTIADKKIDGLIYGIIKKTFPDHGILSEESKTENLAADFLWIIDPIDGTLAFSHGLPGFSISIGLYYKKKPFFGLVFAPAKKELFWAIKNKGAYLNNKKINVTKTKTFDKAVMSAMFAYKREGTIFEKHINLIKKMAQKSQYVYGPQSTALGICYVAGGRFDGIWFMEGQPYDFAAASIILNEAGGVYSHIDGTALNLKKNQSFLGSNRHLHEKLLKIMK